MFPSRPVPPHVEPAAKEAWVQPSGGSASLVARIRRQPFAQQPTPTTDESIPDIVEPASAPSASPSASRQDTLMRRLEEEWTARNPLADAKRTSVPSCTIAVLCLPPDATDDDLRRFGERFGRVVATRVVRQKGTGASRKYGFIQYSYAREMQRAVRECSDPTLPRPRILGKIVVVEMERGRLDPQYAPGRFRRLRDIHRCVTPHDDDDAAASAHATIAAAPSRVAEPTTAAEVLDNLDDFLSDFA
jgi:RNA recognition motif-containing protein